VDSYLLELCEKGWAQKIVNKVENIDTYKDRLNYEFKVLTGAKLSSYFLIVQDILGYVRQQGWLPGPGRGSAAGCLVSYLIGITSIDPIKYDLYFERFYNAGRNTADRVSMPDIDVDVPVTKREQIIQYIKQRYGNDKVSQMITYQTMKGRGAIKDVLRAHNAVTASEMNLITRHFPEEAKIADELQDMKEEVRRGERDEGDVSIIRWALENDDKGLLKDWCSLDADGKLMGPLARFFEQAIRLEGTKSSQSKHAAGILIAPEPLADICPMVYDSKTESMIAGLEMNDAEEIGMIKYDILGVAMLDKVAGVADILNLGDINDNDN
jgi:DNA polymerase-3 subunit alpha